MFYFAKENSFSAIAGVILGVCMIIYGVANWDKTFNGWDNVKDNWLNIILVLLGFAIVALLATGYDFTANNIY